MSSPLVTVLRRRVPKPVGSMPAKPPILAQKMSQINQMDSSVRKILLNTSLAYRSIKIWEDRVEDNFNWQHVTLEHQ
jgi:hypothetical protein